MSCFYNWIINKTRGKNDKVLIILNNKSNKRINDKNTLHFVKNIIINRNCFVYCKVSKV